MQQAPYRYTAHLAGEIEERWQRTWEQTGAFHAVDPEGEFSDGRPISELGSKLFVLDMFPYPSGKGLHVGHPLGYIATDVLARFARMQGKNVLYTMGYDSFGLPAEQYAIQTGTHPRVTTEDNVANMARQLFRLGLSHDRRRAIRTTDMGFVKWTQWIFLQIFDSWYDPDAVNPDGSRGRARPIAELKPAIQDRDVDPWDLAQRLGIELPEYWKGRKPADDVWNPAHDTPFDWLVQYEPEHMRELVDAFRLAYISDTAVNWCPGLGTVLANEEVTADGRSERGNFPVFKRRLRQWNLRITAYADRLADDLDALQWPESIKAMQRHWIGRSRGAQVRFAIAAGAHGHSGHEFDVFTTRVDTLFGATFAVLAPEHALLRDIDALPESWPEGTPDAWTSGAAHPRDAVREYRQRAQALDDDERTADDRVKTGVFTGMFAVNPMDGRTIPIFTADYVLTSYGTGAIMAVPAEDQRDYDFASAFDLPVIRTVQPPADFDEGKAYTGEGVKINSASAELDLNGLSKDEAIEAALKFAISRGFGRARTTYRLRDWLFSRQRYWGEPFPIVYAEDAPETPIALAPSMLPVELPELEDFSPTTFDPNDAQSEPQTPLSRKEDWVRVELDLGDGPKIYRRETNVMPQWAGSSWYEIRYTDPTNESQMASFANERYWMGPRDEGDPGGADLYVGGVEHAVLHLLYARFWHKVLHDRGYLSSSEPFHRLFNQGYVQAYAYTDERGVYVDASEVREQADGTFTFEGRPVTREYGKMGKSLRNIVTPDDMYEQYGADTFRVYEMSMAPLDLSRPWNTRDIVGSQRFLQRMWRLVVDEHTGALAVSDGEADIATRRAVHAAIAGVRADMEEMRFNTAISKMIELVNTLTKVSASGGGVAREAVEPLVLMLAPFAPHLAEELWHRLGHDTSLTREPFPEADPQYLVAEAVTCVIQVKGKVRHKIEVDPGISEADLERVVLAEERVQQLLEGQTLRKIIVRAPKLVNLVI